MQFNETTLNFVMRLAEHAGIYFYSKHALGTHTIVFCDEMNPTLPGYEKIPFLTPRERTLQSEEHITEWIVEQQVRSGSFATRSYNFLQPGADLEKSETVKNKHSNDELEIYEWAGTYGDHDEGEKTASARLGICLATIRWRD